jgi:hypothetical protein
VEKGTRVRIAGCDPLFRGLAGVVQYETKDGWILVELALRGVRRTVPFRAAELTLDTPQSG